MNRRAVFEQVATCTNCELHAGCTGPVPFRGDRSHIAILGEAPGEQEDTQGRPFVGPSGQLVEELFAEVGLPPTERLGVCNVVSCWPHGAPNWDHVNACAGNKWAQLNYIDPTYILLLGKVALKSMRPDLELKHGRGRPFTVNDRICFATYHPAAALRNGNYRDAMVSDLETFRDLVAPTGAPPWPQFIPNNCAGCLNDAEWFETSGLGWCRIHLPAALVPAYEARQAQLNAELDAVRRSAGRRDFALARVAAAADPDWMALAWDTLVEYLRTHPEFFVDDFWADTGLPEPREARALGPIVMRAARQNLMEKTGRFKKSVRSNLTEKPAWRSLIYEGTP